MSSNNVEWHSFYDYLTSSSSGTYAIRGAQHRGNCTPPNSCLPLKLLPYVHVKRACPGCHFLKLVSSIPSRDVLLCSLRHIRYRFLARATHALYFKHLQCLDLYSFFNFHEILLIITTKLIICHGLIKSCQCLNSFKRSRWFF